MKRITILILALALQTNALSQNGWLPPVYFNGSTTVCDSTPFRMVFYDEFEGSRLAPPWLTFITWDGKDDDDWASSRKWEDNGIIKDENVVVSGGTVKLQVKNERSSWNCRSCPTSNAVTRSLTFGSIVLPYSKGFNNGKFEARIRFPSFRGAWCTFWLWKGNTVNEIDIAESWGGSRNWPYFGAKAHSKTTFSLHAWHEQLFEPINPYNLPQDAEDANQYPKQGWWNFFIGNKFRQDEWHIYTCEWDTAVVKTYLDGNLQAVIWKYWQERTYRKWWNPLRTYRYKVGSDCIPSAGIWQITKGFPYNNRSHSQLRLTTGVQRGLQGDQSLGTFVKGEMEVDYVKVWQRHPDEGWIGRSGSNSQNTDRAKEINNDVATVVTEVHCQETGMLYYSLHAEPLFKCSNSILPICFEWDIAYGPDFSLHQNVLGQTVSTLPIPDNDGTAYPIKWRLKITHGQREVIETGQQSFYQMRKLLGSGKEGENWNTQYFVANIPDLDAYETAVDKRLQSKFIPIERSTSETEFAVVSAIEKIELEELGPYIVSYDLRQLCKDLTCR